MSDTFSTGDQATLTFYDPNDDTFITINGLTNFEATPRITDLESHPNDGRNLFAKRYMGWNLTFEYDRYDGRLDRYFAQREARQRSGLPDSQITVTQTVVENNGSTTQYRFTGCALAQESGGSWQREQKVTGRVNGMADKRELVG